MSQVAEQKIMEDAHYIPHSSDAINFRVPHPGDVGKTVWVRDSKELDADDAVWRQRTLVAVLPDGQPGDQSHSSFICAERGRSAKNICHPWRFALISKDHPIAPQPEPSPSANVPETPDSSVDHSADASKMVQPKIVARYDTEGRDVTELPGLWSEDDTQYREVIEGDLASGPIDCEVRNSDSEEWKPAVLCYIVHQSDRPFRVLKDRMEDSKGKWPYCRIKVAPAVKQSLTPDTPDQTKITIGYTVPNAYEQSAEPITEPIQRKRVLYIAGPMRGIAFFNYPMFDRVAEQLREAGNDVISPADEDRKHDDFDPFANPEYRIPDACVFPHEMDFGKTVRRCLDAVLRCDEIVLLPGWENSNGAVAELTLAMWLGKRVRQLKIADNGEFYWACYWPGLAGLAVKLRDHHIPEVAAPAPVVVDEDDEDEDILDTAARITRGDRNASYGPPDQDFRRTAGMWSALFASKLQDGEMFDPRDVAMAMILLKCSRESHQRKLDNWVDIAGYARCGSMCN